MGNALSGNRTKLVTLAEDPLSWRLRDVEGVFDGYVAGNLDFGVSKLELLELLKAVGAEGAVEELWRLFGESNNGTEVNVLELLAGLAVVSNASFEEKFLFVLKLFHFDDDDDSALSYDELSFALECTLSGASLFLQRGSTFDEGHLRDAFLFLCKDTHTGKVGATDLWKWLETKYLPKLCRDNGIPGTIATPHQFLTCFDAPKDKRGSGNLNLLLDNEHQDHDDILRCATRGAAAAAAPGGRKKRKQTSQPAGGQGQSE